MSQVKSGSGLRRVSTDALAAMLASDGWVPDRHVASKGRGRVKKLYRNENVIKNKQRTFDREGVDVLPPGHPVTWKALWGADLVPVFPGLQAMGSRDGGWEIN